MLVLDTNHLREYSRGTTLGQKLAERLLDSTEDVVTTVVCAEEIQRGWLARIHSSRNPLDEASAYQSFSESIFFLGRFHILPWDLEAHSRFSDFRRRGLRIGTLDLRIACITMEHDAVLLTRNALDFSKVPGLRIENWLD